MVVSSAVTVSATLGVAVSAGCATADVDAVFLFGAGSGLGLRPGLVPVEPIVVAVVGVAGCLPRTLFAGVLLLAGVGAVKASVAPAGGRMGSERPTCAAKVLPAWCPQLIRGSNEVEADIGQGIGLTFRLFRRRGEEPASLALQLRRERGRR